VTDVQSLVAVALETAEKISQKSPIAVMGTKHIILHAQDHSYAFLFPVELNQSHATIL
jgi:enoyl-CoA hydratase/carnithine racemase